MPIETDPRRRIVITGMGTINPSGSDLETCWENWVNGKSAITTTLIGYPPDQTLELAGKIEKFDITDYGVSKARAGRLSLTAQYALAAGLLAHKDANIQNIDPDKIGVIVGTAMGGAQVAADVREKISRVHALDDKEDLHTISNLDANMPSAALARFINAEGGAFSPSEACATGAFTGMLARDRILQGDNDVVFAGGAEASLVEVGYRGFQMWDALSPYIDTPETASRPFDKTAKGFVIGEGAGVLVYERLSHAQDRGATIYGEFLGYGFVSAANEPIKPKAKSEAKAIRKLLTMTGLSPDMIDYINGHAAGTPAGDGEELDAIENELGEYSKIVPIDSTKSMIGHAMGAAGAIELIATLLTMLKGEIHPNPTLEEACRDGFNLPKERLKRMVLIAIKNAFGLNGAYFSGAYGKYPEWQEKLAA